MARYAGHEDKHVVTAGIAFAERLKQVRTRKGWSQAALSERLNELGYPMNRVTLAKIETGGTRARNVTLEEVFAISYALGVSPLFMSVPYSPESRLQVVPVLRPSTPLVARAWLAGGWTLADEDVDFFARELPPDERFIDVMRDLWSRRQHDQQEEES
jgi:transcriptional regulator with XRE-family HTH domain